MNEEITNSALIDIEQHAAAGATTNGGGPRNSVGANEKVLAV